MKSERGIVLMMAIVAAIIFSIAAFAMLTVAMSHRRRIKEFDVDRLRARYAAEAGLVWAREQLWSNPSFCPQPLGADPKQPPFPLANTNDLIVTVAVDPCGGTQHKITATVNY